MYKHHPTLVLGFHACEHKIGEEILGGTKGFKASENDFDWLGSGMYFWENSPSRAKSYGIELKEKRNKLNNPMVIGAVIHLGRCFDLLEYHCLEVLQEHYLSLKKLYSTANKRVIISNIRISENIRTCSGYIHSAAVTGNWDCEVI